MHMSGLELKLAARDWTRGDIEDKSLDEIHRIITTSQFVTDLCLHELEKRGELRGGDGEAPCVPYHSDFWIETILTRG